MKSLVLVLIVAIAQAQPVRDAIVQPTVGTASISGQVVNDEEQPKPVRRAIVTLTGSDLRPSRGAITDDEGRFAFANLPPGRVTLTVTRASFITSVSGAKRPGRPGTAIAVAAGEAVTGLVVKAWRGAACGLLLSMSGGHSNKSLVQRQTGDGPGAATKTVIDQVASHLFKDGCRVAFKGWLG